MNPKPWLPLIAFTMFGAHLLATKAAQLRTQLRGARVQPGGPSDVEADAMGPSKPWTSITSRVTHVVEEYATITIATLFVAGMVGMLIGV